jgi:hypothetical protein
VPKLGLGGILAILYHDLCKAGNPLEIPFGLKSARNDKSYWLPEAECHEIKQD